MMQTLPLGQVFLYVRHDSRQLLYNSAGEYPVYTFRKGERLRTDYPGLKGNGFIISKYNAPRIKDVQGQFDIGRDCLFFRVVNEYYVDYRYVYYYLLCNIENLRRYYRGSSLQRLAITEFLDMPISLPSLAEQKTVVAMLSAVESAKVIRESQMDKFNGFLARYLKTTAGESSSKYWMNATIGNLTESSAGIRNVKSIENDARDGDVILTSTGAVFVYSPRQTYKEVKGRVMCITVDKKKCNPYFLATVFKYDREVLAQIRKPLGNGYMFILNQYALGRILVMMPSIEQQNDFAKVVLMYESIVSRMRRISLRIEELRQSLLWNIFHGIDGKANAALFDTGDVCDIYNRVQDCNIDDYDIMRGNVYRMLSEGSLEQYFDDTTKTIKLRNNETVES